MEDQNKKSTQQGLEGRPLMALNTSTGSHQWHSADWEEGWNEAIRTCRSQLQRLALASGWDTSSPAYICDQLLTSNLIPANEKISGCEPTDKPLPHSKEALTR